MSHLARIVGAGAAFLAAVPLVLLALWNIPPKASHDGFVVPGVTVPMIVGWIALLGALGLATIGVLILRSGSRN